MKDPVCSEADSARRCAACVGLGCALMMSFSALLANASDPGSPGSAGQGFAPEESVAAPALGGGAPAAPASLRSPEFRGFWANAFVAGFKSTSEINSLISRAQTGNYNAIVPEVLAFHDSGTSAHGAYWNSSIVPKATDISGGIDPLAYLIQQAHAVGIEVHPWLVAFRVSTTWPPNNNPLVGAHPEWLMVRQSDMNQGPRKLVDGNPDTPDYYTFDPGSPEVQTYLMSIVRELCENYEIDGIHWDYIRYTQTDAGYPTDSSYEDSTLRRFQDITGYVGTPPDGLASWDDFRRRTVTEVVRRAMLEIPLIDNPRQPLRHSGALVTWYPANTNFHLTRPYYDAFSDWEDWQSKGYVDTTIPMCYFDDNDYSSTYRSWVDNSVAWANNYNRHTFIGPGIYMNTFAQSQTQIEYALNAGAHGICTYSYSGTNDGGQPWANWYSYIATNVFTEPATIPTMPWRDPATATKGTIYGRVADGMTGEPLDDAEVLINGFPFTRTDGNGYFLLTNLSAPAGGVAIPISVSADGYAEVVRPAVLIERAGFTEANFGLGTWLAGDYDVDGAVDLNDWAEYSACATAPGDGPLAAGCDLFDFDGDSDIDLADFRVLQGSFGQ